MQKRAADYLDELGKKFPELLRRSLSQIVVFGLRKMESARNGNRLDVRITDGRGFYIFYGWQIHDNEKRRKSDNKLKFKKCSYVSRKRNTPFRGYYYVGMTSQEFLQYLRKRKKKPRIKLSKRAFGTDTEIIESIRRYTHLFKVKFPFSLQHVTMIEWEADYDDFTLVKTRNSKRQWRKCKGIPSEKELTKI